YSTILVYRLYLAIFLFFFCCTVHHRDLHSFPTRRSSDLDKHLNVEARLDIPAQRERSASQADEARALTVRRSNAGVRRVEILPGDRKSTRLNSSHVEISYAVFCLKKKKKYQKIPPSTQTQ